VTIVSRFAPAPTGFLHLGHVVNAIFVWGIVRAVGGRVLLRIEDHDRRRSRPQFERAILEDLEWLGFVPDEPPPGAFDGTPCAGRQSDRHDVYLAALDGLRARGLVYACACSRRLRGSSADAGHEQRYPGTCAARGLPEGPGAGLRLRLDRTVEHFDDLRHGRHSQRPAEQCGDLLVRDRDGNWTYQFAVTVDDWVQGVNLVIRGDDLLGSVGRQIYLARVLGRAEPPWFLHHPLVMKTATEKLSKAGGDTAIRDLRAAGFTAPAVIGRAARFAGLTSHDEPVGAADVSMLIPALAHIAGRLGRGLKGPQSSR
jgi:glutamyl-tRNA synthetase/glutamyl-Q tRNA(Asp) synthetase